MHLGRALTLLLQLSGLSAMGLASCFAQDQEPEPDPARVIGQTIEQQLLLEVESRLQSRELATIAWGGYLAAQHRLAAAVPALRRALRELPEGEHRKHAAQSLLDALAVHGAKLSADELAAFTAGMQEGVAVVLAAHDPAVHRDFLLQLYRSNDQQGRYSRWLAAGNLLAGVADREFGRHLIGQLAYQIDVSVCDPDAAVGFGIGGGAGGKFADGKLETPLGFPPTVTYQIVVDAKLGDVLMAPGKYAIFYRREVHHERRIGIGLSERMQLRGRQQRRVEWLAAMLDCYLSDLPALRSETVQWQDRASLLVAIEKFRAEIVNSHDQLLDKAVAAGWLADTERGEVAAKVAVKLWDRRSDKTELLPEVR